MVSTQAAGARSRIHAIVCCSYDPFASEHWDALGLGAARRLQGVNRDGLPADAPVRTVADAEATLTPACSELGGLVDAVREVRSHVNHAIGLVLAAAFRDLQPAPGSRPKTRAVTEDLAAAMKILQIDPSEALVRLVGGEVSSGAAASSFAAASREAPASTARGKFSISAHGQEICEKWRPVTFWFARGARAPMLQFLSPSLAASAALSSCPPWAQPVGGSSMAGVGACEAFMVADETGCCNVVAAKTLAALKGRESVANGARHASGGDLDAVAVPEHPPADAVAALLGRIEAGLGHPARPGGVYERVCLVRSASALPVNASPWLSSAGPQPAKCVLAALLELADRDAIRDIDAAAAVAVAWAEHHMRQWTLGGTFRLQPPAEDAALVCIGRGRPSPPPAEPSIAGLLAVWQLADEARSLSVLHHAADPASMTAGVSVEGVLLADDQPGPDAVGADACAVEVRSLAVAWVAGGSLHEVSARGCSTTALPVGVGAWRLAFGERASSAGTSHAMAVSETTGEMICSHGSAGQLRPAPMIISDSLAASQSAWQFEGLGSLVVGAASFALSESDPSDSPDRLMCVWDRGSGLLISQRAVRGPTGSWALVLAPQASGGDSPGAGESAVMVMLGRPVARVVLQRGFALPAPAPLLLAGGRVQPLPDVGCPAQWLPTIDASPLALVAGVQAEARRLAQHLVHSTGTNAAAETCAAVAEDILSGAFCGASALATLAASAGSLCFADLDAAIAVGSEASRALIRAFPLVLRAREAVTGNAAVVRTLIRDGSDAPGGLSCIPAAVKLLGEVWSVLDQPPPPQGRGVVDLFLSPTDASIPVPSSTASISEELARICGVESVAASPRAALPGGAAGAQNALASLTAALGISEPELARGTAKHRSLRDTVGPLRAAVDALRGALEASAATRSRPSTQQRRLQQLLDPVLSVAESTVTLGLSAAASHHTLEATDSSAPALPALAIESQRRQLVAYSLSVLVPAVAASSAALRELQQTHRRIRAQLVAACSSQTNASLSGSAVAIRAEALAQAAALTGGALVTQGCASAVSTLPLPLAEPGDRLSSGGTAPAALASLLPAGPALHHVLALACPELLGAAGHLPLPRDGAGGTAAGRVDSALLAQAPARLLLADTEAATGVVWRRVKLPDGSRTPHCGLIATRCAALHAAPPTGSSCLEAQERLFAPAGSAPDRAMLLRSACKAMRLTVARRCVLALQPLLEAADAEVAATPASWLPRHPSRHGAVPSLSTLLVQQLQSRQRPSAGVIPTAAVAAAAGAATTPAGAASSCIPDPIPSPYKHHRDLRYPASRPASIALHAALPGARASGLAPPAAFPAFELLALLYWFLEPDRLPSFVRSVEAACPPPLRAMPAGTTDQPTRLGTSTHGGATSATGVLPSPAEQPAPASAVSETVPALDSHPSRRIGLDPETWASRHDPSTAVAATDPACAPWFSPKSLHAQGSGPQPVAYISFASRALRVLPAPAKVPLTGEDAQSTARAVAYADLLQQAGHAVWSVAFALGSGLSIANEALLLAEAEEEDGRLASDIASRLGRIDEDHDAVTLTTECRLLGRAAEGERQLATAALAYKPTAGGLGRAGAQLAAIAEAAKAWTAGATTAGAAPLLAWLRPPVLEQGPSLGDPEDSWLWEGASSGPAAEYSPVRFAAGLDWVAGICLGAAAAAESSEARRPAASTQKALPAVGLSAARDGTGAAKGGARGIVAPRGGGSQGNGRLRESKSTDGPPGARFAEADTSPAMASSGSIMGLMGEGVSRLLGFAGRKPDGTSSSQGSPVDGGDAGSHGPAAAVSAQLAGPDVTLEAAVAMASRGGREAGPEVLGRSEIERRIALIAGRRAWAPSAVSRVAIFHATLRSALSTGEGRGGEAARLSRLLQRAPTAGYGLGSLAAAVLLGPAPEHAASVSVASAVVCGAALVDRVAQRLPQSIAVLSAGAVAQQAVLEAVPEAETPAAVPHAITAALLPALEAFARMEAASLDIEAQAAHAAAKPAPASRIPASWDAQVQKKAQSALQKLKQGIQGLVRSSNEAKLAGAAIARAQELASVQSE